MIPEAAITAWRYLFPWGSPDQVEHDLVISRAICELYSNPVVVENLVFRGGTALHKLFFDQAGRFSEDLDFVQIHPRPIGETVNAIRDCLDSWLGQPNWEQNQGRFTITYRFNTEIEPISTRKVKVEINTREHFCVQPYVRKPFNVTNAWFNGRSQVQTYSIEELLATKLRALYQRKKGRDLYDIWYVKRYVPSLDTQVVIDIFQQYMQKDNTRVSRAEFEKNLFLKQQDIVFNNDIKPLLSNEQSNLYDMEQAFNITGKDFLTKLLGDPWRKKMVDG